jgi:hypothetical protein
MEKGFRSKFKYFLSPENNYVIDYGDFSVEITGAEIMSRLYREFHLERLLLDDTDTDSESSQK